MVFGSEPYTMRQIAEALAPMGAGARMTENEFGSCACDWLYGGWLVMPEPMKKGDRS